MKPVRAVLLIPLLGLLFYHDLVRHPNQVLYSDYSDLLALHLPAKSFLVHAWHTTGDLPRWCPYQFAGEPFLHDIQAAVFYPPHLLLLLLPEDCTGAALSWLVVLHGIAAGLFMYAYARDQGLEELAAVVAAVGYMFAGGWLLRMLLGGHYLLIGLAWLPLLLLLLERALRRHLLWAVAAGVVLGLMILGTLPQSTFYGGLFVALWTLGTALDTSDGQRRVAALARWAGSGLIAGLIAVGLTAVQLLPTLEATRLSSRALGIGAEEVLGGGLRSLVALVGPSLAVEPINWQWEDRGGLALLWLFAAVLAARLGRGLTRYRAAVALVLLIFAAGGAIVVQRLPGFQLFRQPARMFTILPFPIAFLAGTATQLLFAAAAVPAERPHICRRLLLRVLAAVGILTGGFALRLLLEGKPIRPHVYWISLAVTVPAAFWLLGHAPPATRQRRAWLWALLLLIDSWALTLPLVATRPEGALYAPSASVDFLMHHRREPGRVLDRDDPPGGSATPLGAGAPLAMRLRLESLRGYNPVDNLRYKEYLQFIAGSDAPLQAQNGPLTYPILGDFPIVNKRLLDLLGVRYLVQPTARLPEHRDQWQAVSEDEHPAAFDFITGGRRELSPYTVWENRTVLPRAFIVFRAAPLPEGHAVLPRLRNTDFRTEVLLEHAVSDAETKTPAGAARRAIIRQREPNRVVVEVEPGPAGWLVLADLWYPGWTCRIDDNPVSVERADYLFRAVAVPEGRREIVFTFEPQSYYLGRRISLLTLGGVVLLLAGACLTSLIWRRDGAYRSGRSETSIS